MTGRAADVIKEAGVFYTADVDISGLSTLGLTARAAYLAVPKSRRELVTLLCELNNCGIPHRVVGGMSNTMPSSEYYDGVLINIRNIGTKSLAEGSVFAECGVRLSQLVSFLSQNNLGGFEQLYHIPGTLGGSVYGNAGAHGLEISDVLLSCELYDIRSDEIKRVRAAELGFSYRYSRLKREPLVLLSCELKAEEVSKEESRRRILHYADLRKNQPRGVRTLGSTFKRVGDVSAGYYIDKAGLKGFAVGGAEVSKVHAGFIINRGGATPRDVLTLIDIIKERVYRTFAVELEPEIEFL